MKKLKEHWQIIVIVLLLLFGLNKCSQSCNRQGTIDKQETRIQMLDSIVSSQKLQIDFLQRDTTDYLNQIRMLQKFDTQRNYSDSINAANLARQREQTDALVKQNQRIINKLNENK